MRSVLLLGAMLLPPSLHAGALDELLSQSGTASLAEVPVELPAVLAPARRRIFKVLSFNIKGNPEAWISGWGRARFAVIGDELARRRADGDAPDVVVLQESFGPGTSLLRRHAGYPHMAEGPRAQGTLLDGGLWTLSLHPISQSRSVAFTHDTCGSFDCWATKGMHLTRISVSGVPYPVDVHNTHMQSGGRPRDESSRVRQIEQFAAAFLPAGQAHPALFIGDFNTGGHRPGSYGTLLSVTGLANAGGDCLQAPDVCYVAPGTVPEELEARTHDQHLYVRSGPGYRVRPIYAARIYGPVGIYSDHLAYEVHYELSW
jgi:endonuclease/exonuclease/phosphatase family metal-dependent hydrolase